MFVVPITCKNAPVPAVSMIEASGVPLAFFSITPFPTPLAKVTEVPTAAPKPPAMVAFCADALTGIVSNHIATIIFFIVRLPR